MAQERKVELIRRAIELSKMSVKNGNHPFGALLALDGEIVLEAENSVCVDHDVTRHAELNLVSLASKKFEPSYLEKCTLFTSTEPCAMCSGALYWAGIRSVVYSCDESRLGEIVKRKQKGGEVKELGDKDGGLDVPCRDILRDRCCVEGPILEEESAAIHEKYW
eukprot:CAMPEP_0201491366 /NCGR_PEP_ID=MMETSP0151_2-20130828/29594_1 /ASSEMBLY_ACC=CAM_ASM_000257 /TAXON_ID=200890 /ORGANISM="Paramoeba atlantica, Strain 621/1 / CCAP 1560/9" /LENGTH=163 /DNA_ID=CAMNT_0047877695 /DNA_START=43 /DNA_END=534 /DNA_ORIENTATION=-